MLYDIAPIPFRYCNVDKISTLIPIFNYDYENRDESIMWLGQDVPVDEFTLDNSFKYKTIEIVNDATIERVFLTAEPIDFKKSWWTSDIKIFPLWSRSWSMDEHGIRINRYLNGINEFLGEFGTTTCCPCTIHDVTKKILMRTPENFIPGLKQTIDNYLTSWDPNLIHGNDIENIRNLIDALQIYKDRRYIGNGFKEELAKFKKNVPVVKAVALDNELAQADKTLSIFKTIKHQDFGLAMCSVLMAETNPLFEMKEDSDVKFYEEDVNLRSEFLELCTMITYLPCTDIGLKIGYHLDKDLTVWCEAYSRYTGISNRLTKDKFFMEQVNRIVALLTKWQYKSLRKEITSISLQKSWTEELFIETTYLDNKGKEKKQRYYIDLVMHTIGTISAMDALDPIIN